MLYPIADGYTQRRISIVESLKARPNDDTDEELAARAYRDFLFESMVEVTMHRLGNSLAQSSQGLGPISSFYTKFGQFF